MMRNGGEGRTRLPLAKDNDTRLSATCSNTETAKLRWYSMLTLTGPNAMNDLDGILHISERGPI